MPTHFDHGAAGSKIAFQDHQAACRLQRLAQWRDYALTRGFFRGARFFGKCFSRHRHRGTVRELAVEQPLGDHRDAARSVHVRCHILSPRLQISQQRRAFTYSLNVVDVKGQSHFA